MPKHNSTALAVQSSENRSRFVAADPSPHQPPMLVYNPPMVADLLPPVGHTGHARQEDDAITQAQATLMVSAAYIAAAALITVGLLLLAYLFRALGDGWGAYTYTGLIVWGGCVLLALWGNRRQSLHHSPTGISHAEIESRERIALHALNLHADLLTKRWEHDHADH